MTAYIQIVKYSFQNVLFFNAIFSPRGPQNKFMQSSRVFISFKRKTILFPEKF